jgi:hypothetical protein
LTRVTAGTTSYLGAQPGDRGAQLALGPDAEGEHADARDAERRQHLADVGGQRGPVRHDEQVRGRELARVRVGEVREAVQPDGGLAAARAALDDDDARGARRDELELPRVDERRDLWQVAIEGLGARR